MKVLVVGGGAREHTLVWKLAQSPRVNDIYAAPGNAGTAQIGHNLDIPAANIEALLEAIRKEHIELAVIGPEGPLSEGIVDRFQNAGIMVFGPTRGAAEIESSKVFSKALMQKYKIPCGQSAVFSNCKETIDYVKQKSPPIVVKADGLAAGKGVVVAETIDAALSAISSFMKDKSLGDAAKRIIIEEFLPGKEMSAFVLTDGKTLANLPAACDYKRVFDGDSGPNTGGMGSYSPPHFYDASLEKSVIESVMLPTVRAMAAEGRPYKGVLYGGLMVSENKPKVLEFNARFGDPETQVVLPRLKSDLLELILAVTEGKLDKTKPECSDEVCVGVVMASGGYPGPYKTGIPISGLDDVDKDVMVFHAGTKIDGGKIVSSGGRVLTVVALGGTVAEARQKVYTNLPRIKFEGLQYRMDIARF